MTDVAYRKPGLICKIMEEIDKDYGDRAEGCYLFANDSVLDLYLKFGYRRAEEYQYSKQVSGEDSIMKSSIGTMHQVPMKDKKAWDILEYVINTRRCYGRFTMVDNSGLFMFYVTKWESIFG